MLIADTLTITLPTPLANDLRSAAAADACGLSPEEYVRQSLAEEFEFDAGHDWEADDLARLREAGEDADAAIVFSELRDDIEKARRAKP